jgi:hypothetical protein
VTLARPGTVPTAVSTSEASGAGGAAPGRARPYFFFVFSSSFVIFSFGSLRISLFV